MKVKKLFLLPFLLFAMSLAGCQQGEGEGDTNGKSALSHLGQTIAKLYNKYAPYSFAEVQEKTKQLGHPYTVREYTSEVVLIGGLFAVVGWMYFYSIPFALFYAIIAIMFIPYLSRAESSPKDLPAHSLGGFILMILCSGEISIKSYILVLHSV